MNRMRLLKTIERFWANTRRNGNDCWPWMGATNNQGYGVLAVYSGDKRQRVLAHRLSIVIATGADIDGRAQTDRCPSSNAPQGTPRRGSIVSRRRQRRAARAGAPVA